MNFIVEFKLLLRYLRWWAKGKAFSFLERLKIDKNRTFVEFYFFFREAIRKNLKNLINFAKNSADFDWFYTKQQFKQQAVAINNKKVSVLQSKVCWTWFLIRRQEKKGPAKILKLQTKLSSKIKEMDFNQK